MHMRKINIPKPAKPQADVDPEVEQLAALLQHSGMTDDQIAEKVGKARGSKMSPETVRGVRELITKRPQNFTLSWVGWAIGKRRVWQDI